MATVNHLELYRHLSKSNCRECGLPTCMAFALAVVNDERKIRDCPLLDKEKAEDLERKLVRRDRQKDYAEAIDSLKKSVAGVDFKAGVKGLGAELKGDRLCIKCLGKDFFIDSSGNVDSAVHLNSWIMMPLLKYITTCGNSRPSDRWVSLEQLKGGATMGKYFSRRCEEPLRQLAESHTDLFFDLLNIFASKEAEGFSADYCRIIRPLPKLPFLILYWKPEDHFESKLKVLFRDNADTYLDAHSIYVLTRGIVEMFKNILSRHDQVMPGLLAL